MTSSRLQFDGNYEYYSESEDDYEFEEEEESDFFTTPPASPSHSSIGHTPDRKVDYSDYSENEEPVIQHEVPEMKPFDESELPPPPKLEPLAQAPAMRSASPFTPQYTVEEETNTVTNTAANTATSVRRRRPQRGQMEEQKPAGNIHESKIFGSRIMAAANLRKDNKEQVQESMSQTGERQSSIYGSRRRRQQQNIQMEEAPKLPPPPLIPINSEQTQSEYKQSSIYGSRRRTQITVQETQNEQKESSIYGSRVNRTRQRTRQTDTQQSEASSIYGSRVNRKANQIKQSSPLEMSIGSRGRRGAEESRDAPPPPAPIVRSVRSRTRGTVTSTRNYETYDSYTYDDDIEMQRLPPLPSPKSTTVVSTTIGSPTKNYSRKY